MLIGAVNEASAASFPLRLYEELKKDKSFDIWIAGIGEGYLVANAALASRNQPMLYCHPGKLTLMYTNYRNILDEEVKRAQPVPYYPDMPLSMILLYGLQKTFPCSS
jgi:hypothetical protein